MKRAVFTSFDELYVSYALVMVKTFCENYSGDPIDFYCLVPESLNVLEDDFKDACKSHANVRVKFITLDGQKEIDKRFASNDIAISYITPQCFHRIFIADEFPELDQAIYIDPDTMVLGDISGLLEYPLEMPIVAMYEGIDSYKESVVGKDRSYFNNGVYKTDLSFWRDNNISRKMISHVNENGLMRYPEQDLMNIFLCDSVSSLPIKFNYLSWFDKYDFFVNEEPAPAIVHFTGPDKPWKNNDGLEQRLDGLWRDKFKEIFGIDIKSVSGFLDNYEFDKNWDGFK